MSSIEFKIPVELLERYATSAPRYTSYPTAVDWKNDAPPSAYPEHLARSAAENERCAVYVHIPFCEELCLYCGCNVVITHNHQKAVTYRERLTEEIVAVAKAQGRRRTVTQYHWGGGTPTYLKEEEIQALQEAFLAHFDLAHDAEVAIEVDPRVTSRGQLRLLGRLGFNRLSLGIQDFDVKVQEAVRRVQSYDETRAVILEGRASGFSSVNVDLIYGLPHQTFSGFATTLEQVLTLAPERVALFHYAHVPWMKKHQRALDVDAMPSSSEKMRIFTHAVATFTAAGYEYLGLDHFALPADELARARADRTLQRNFMGYSTRGGVDLIGLGVSAIGEVGGAYFQNRPQIAEWHEAVASGVPGVGRGHLLSDADRLRRRVIMNLMCHGVIVKCEIAEEFRIDFDRTFERELRELVPLSADGLVQLLPDRIVLPRLGQVFMRNVAVVFDSYFRERQQRGGASQQTFSRTL